MDLRSRANTAGACTVEEDAGIVEDDDAGC
jgi:hypothetical protein